MDRIMIGIVMLLISALGTTNGIRDLLQRDFISGFLNIMNSFLGAAGIAFGIALAMLLLNGVSSEGIIISHSVAVQLISWYGSCTGFALWFKIKGRQVLYSSVGAFLPGGCMCRIRTQTKQLPGNSCCSSVCGTLRIHYVQN
ncbi:MAG: threonine/serine exporter family protein [Lachnoclostridium sp.]